MDVVLLSRIQFALTIAFHYIFPPLTIGMGVVMVFLEGRFLRTKQPIYEVAAKFWTKSLCPQFRHRCRHGNRHGISVRNQLGDLLAVRRGRLRFGPGGGRNLRLLPRIRIPRRARLRMGQGVAANALLLHPHGGAGLDLFVGVDRCCQQLAADSGGPPHRAGPARRQAIGHQRPARVPRRNPRLLGPRLQPVDRAPSGPRVDRRIHRRVVLHHQHLRLLPLTRTPPRVRPPFLLGRADPGNGIFTGGPRVRTLPIQQRLSLSARQAGRLRRPLRRPDRRT